MGPSFAGCQRMGRISAGRFRVRTFEALVLCLLFSCLPACSSRGTLRIPQQTRAPNSHDEVASGNRAARGDEIGRPRGRVTQEPDATQRLAESPQTESLMGRNAAPSDAAQSERTAGTAWSVVVTTIRPGAHAADPPPAVSEPASASSGHDSTRSWRMKRFVDAGGVLVGAICAVLAVRQRLRTRRRR
jgi:hypothetical protein